MGFEILSGYEQRTYTKGVVMKSELVSEPNITLRMMRNDDNSMRESDYTTMQFQLVYEYGVIGVGKEIL
jgi:hypothetical protein